MNTSAMSYDMKITMLSVVMVLNIIIGNKQNMFK